MKKVYYITMILFITSHIYIHPSEKTSSTEKEEIHKVLQTRTIVIKRVLDTVTFGQNNIKQNDIIVVEQLDGTVYASVISIGENGMCTVKIPKRCLQYLRITHIGQIPSEVLIHLDEYLKT